jgi:hypothetical protein
VHSVHWRSRTGGSMTPRRGRLRTTFILAPQRAQGASMNWSSPMMPSRSSVLLRSVARVGDLGPTEATRSPELGRSPSRRDRAALPDPGNDPASSGIRLPVSSGCQQRPL